MERDMSEVLDGAVCGIDGCTPASSDRFRPAGRSEGLVFNHDKLERTPNTLDAHHLIRLAGQQGKQHDVVEGLFAAYFNEGRDIGDPTVLADIGASAGLDRARILAMLG